MGHQVTLDARPGRQWFVVHAAAAEARSFDLHLGFDPSPIDPDTLLIRLSDLAAVLDRGRETL
jgi:hypothetical protein